MDGSIQSYIHSCQNIHSDLAELRAITFVNLSPQTINEKLKY